MERDIELYGTDVHGTIVIVTDGVAFTVTPERDVAGMWHREADTSENDADTGCLPGTVDINTASLNQLRCIVRIGPVRAQLIVDLRPFESIDDLERVRGIGPQQLEDIKEQGIVCVGLP